LIISEELASEVGLKQIDVSNIENGRPAGSGVTNAKIDALFGHIELPPDGAHANYVKWWRDNSTL
jgi:hypothetical protein